MLRTADVRAIEHILSPFQAARPSLTTTASTTAQVQRITDACEEIEIIVDTLCEGIDIDEHPPRFLVQVYTLIFEAWDSIGAWIIFSIRYCLQYRAYFKFLIKIISPVETLFRLRPESFLSQPIVEALYMHPFTAQLAIAFVLLRREDGKPCFFDYGDGRFMECPIIDFVTSLAIASPPAPLSFNGRLMMLPRSRLATFVRAWIARPQTLTAMQLHGVSKVPQETVASFTSFVSGSEALAESNSAFDHLLLKHGYFRVCVESLAAFVDLLAAQHAPLALPQRGSGLVKSGALGPEDARTLDEIRLAYGTMGHHIAQSPKSVDALIQALRSGILEIASKLETLPKARIKEEARDKNTTVGSLTRWILPLLASRRVLETLRQITVESPDSTWAKLVSTARLMATEGLLRWDLASIARVYVWASTCVLDSCGDVRVNQCSNLKVRHVLQREYMSII